MHRFIGRLSFSPNSLRVQLFLWVALPVAVSLLAISFADVRSHEQAMQRMVQGQADTLAQATAALIESRLEQDRDGLARLAVTLAGREGDGDAVGALAASAEGRRFSAGLAVYDGDGMLVASAHVVGAQRDPDLRWPQSAEVERGVDRVRADGQPFVASLNSSEQGWLLIHAVPMPDGRALAGAIPLDALDLPTLAQTLGLAPSISARLEAADGTPLLVLSGNRQADENARPSRLVTAYGHIDPTGWHVMLQESWTDMVPPVLRFENAVFVVAAAALAVSLLSAYFGVRSIARPLQRLDRAAGQVGWGDTEAIRQPVGGVAEIEDLRQALVQMTERIRHYQQELQSYLGAVTLGQEEERKRLARELHDETVQALIVLNQQVEWIERRLADDPPEAARRLQALRPLLAETIAGLRRQIHDLRPLYLEDLGFVPAVEMLVRQVAQRHQLVGDVEVSGAPVRRLPAAVEISAYRIVQEALNNVVTHAQASWVHVELVFDPQGITLRVEDDGIGFEPPSRSHQLAQDGHYGLLGMQERALLHGGHLHIEGEPGKGSTVQARLSAPVDANAKSSGDPG